jgi:Major Facilitator Superfamily
MDNKDHEHSWLGGLAWQGRSLGALFPIMTTVFIAFLVIGMAMPVLPLHVHQGLELSTFVVGLVAGSQFAAAILSRVWAGRYSDVSGAKHAVIAGLMIAAAGGLFYLLSLRFVTEPVTSAAILLFGRALLGIGESFIITERRVGASRSLVSKTPVKCWRGSEARCSAPLRRARRSAPLSTRATALPGSHSRRRCFRSRRSRWSLRFDAFRPPPGWAPDF